MKPAATEQRGAPLGVPPLPRTLVLIGKSYALGIVIAYVVAVWGGWH